MIRRAIRDASGPAEKVEPTRMLCTEESASAQPDCGSSAKLRMEAVMAVLPVSADIAHLKKQAKDLLREARGGEWAALERFAAALPAVRGVGLAELAGRELRLHDAQSVVAREYGFSSWTELKRYVEWKREEKDATHGARLKSWSDWVYEGTRRERRLAVRMLAEEPGFSRGTCGWGWRLAMFCWSRER